MSVSAPIFSTPLNPASRPLADDQKTTRSFWQQVLHDTLSRTGTRLGLLWISILVFAAVFAPLLANTHPIVAKIDNHWSSPLLHFLAPTDAILMLSAAAVLVLALLGRIRLGKRVLALLVFELLLIPACYLSIHPPLTVDWQEFRDLDRAGRIQYKLMAPIPYSPNDYLRDFPDAPLNAPSRDHLLGTEANGADILSRMIYACRIALSIGLVSTGISLTIAIIVGGAMGYFVGRFDIIGMRLIEMFEAIPTLFLLICIVAFWGRSLYLMMAVIGLTTWTSDAPFHPRRISAPAEAGFRAGRRCCRASATLDSLPPPASQRHLPDSRDVPLRRR